MRKKIRLKYKKERVLLSDVLPYELPVIFSNRYFYRFLVSNGIELKDNRLFWKSDTGKDALAILNFIFGMSTEVNFINCNQCQINIDEKKRVTIPFVYKIQHKPHKLRRLALIHPANQIEVISFYEKFKSLILYYCGKDRFSLRHPKSNACFFYYKDKLHHTLLGKKMDNLELFFNEYENLKTFFSYKEYSNIYKFYEDFRYQNAEKRFCHLHKFDIQSCFDSIYTHTITWSLCGGKDEYKKNFHGKSVSFGDEWDGIMQRMNYNETNGIIIGPEFSRIFAEAILQYVDTRVSNILLKAGYLWKEHYECYRYVDDIFLFYNDTKVMDVAMRAFEEILSEFKMSISKEKSSDYDRPFITPISRAKNKIDSLLKDCITMHDYSDTENTDNILSDSDDDAVLDDIKLNEVLNSNDHIYINSKEFNRAFKSLMMETGVMSNDVMNYTLAVVETKLEKLLKKIDRRFYILCKKIDEGERMEECKRKKKCMEKMILRFLTGLIDVMFFLYADCKRVNTTLKMMNLLNIIITYIGRNYQDKDGKYFRRFSSDVRDEVFKKIQNEIRIVFAPSTFNIDAQLETLYFLITLRSMPKQYRISSERLMKYINDNNKNDLSKFNALSIIILLYYFGNAEEFREYKKLLIDGIDKKYKSSYLNDKRKDAELMILTLDLLSCPYLTHNDRIELCNEMKIAPSMQLHMEKYFKRHKYMFTRWTNVDLTKELGAKVSQEVYT